jgi:hypothetical protein
MTKHKLSEGAFVALNAEHRRSQDHERDFAVGKIAGDPVTDFAGVRRYPVQWIAKSPKAEQIADGLIADWRITRIRRHMNGLHRAVLHALSAGQIPRSQYFDVCRPAAYRFAKQYVEDNFKIIPAWRTSFVVTKLTDYLLKGKP